MKKIVLLSLIFLLPIYSYAVDQKIYFTQKKEVKLFITKMVKKYNFDKSYLEFLFSHARLQPKALEAYTQPIRAYKTDADWVKYTTKILTKDRVEAGKEFLKKYKTTLNRAEKIYKVPKEYIVGMIAIETYFGQFLGKLLVLDSLTTLAFIKNRKQKFFRYELEQFIILIHKENLTPFSLRGSIAGAMGCSQQLPSVHLKYGVDFNKDGVKDLFDMEDCIGTLGNFLHQNGFTKDPIVAVQTNFEGKNFNKLKTGYNKIYKLKYLKKRGINPLTKFPYKKASLLKLRYKDYQEIWLGNHNFQALTSYNHSTNYAMAIHNFAKMLKSPL